MPRASFGPPEELFGRQNLRPSKLACDSDSGTPSDSIAQLGQKIARNTNCYSPPP